MEQFEINLVGEILTVIPNESGTYTILKWDKELAELTPELTDSAGTIWKSKDLTADQAMQIGELIEEHYI